MTGIASNGSSSDLRRRVARRLKSDGWAWVPGFQPRDDGAERLVAVAREFGPLLKDDPDHDRPVVHTSADPEARLWEPFNRPEAIGWHNDFSTWDSRPDLSFAWIRSVPPEPHPRGDWRVVGCTAVEQSLSATERGRVALSFLETHPLPFCFAPGEPVKSFLVIESRRPLRVRFYGRALRLGLASQPVAGAVEAVGIWEEGADRAGQRLRAAAGDLLICDNWRAMHDRLAQAPGRSSVLAFATRP